MGLLITFLMFIAGLWLLGKILPAFVKLMGYCIRLIPLWIILIIFVPGFLDECVLALILIGFAIAKVRDKGYSGAYSSWTSNDYVLNKKSGIIHRKYDSSVDTISNRHRKSISYTEAQNLVNKGTRYRYKKDP